MFDGAFAAVDIKAGELVEKGVMRRLPEGFDGNTCPYIFTWSTERPNKVNNNDNIWLVWRGGVHQKSGTIMIHFVYVPSSK